MGLVLELSNYSSKFECLYKNMACWLQHALYTFVYALSLLLLFFWGWGGGGGAVCVG